MFGIRTGSVALRVTGENDDVINDQSTYMYTGTELKCG